MRMTERRFTLLEHRQDILIIRSPESLPTSLSVCYECTDVRITYQRCALRHDGNSDKNFRYHTRIELNKVQSPEREFAVQ